jgi:hypothetical protein
MAGHRSFKWPEAKGAASPETLSKIFATPYDELKAMTKSDLNKLYRQKAKELHPDTGGDHAKFIELTELYNSLLRTKKN